MFNFALMLLHTDILMSAYVISSVCMIMKHKVIMQFAHTTIWTHVISISYEDNKTLLGTRIL